MAQTSALAFASGLQCLAFASGLPAQRFLPLSQSRPHRAGGVCVPSLGAPRGPGLVQILSTARHKGACLPAVPTAAFPDIKAMPPPTRLRCPSLDSGCRQEVGRGGSSSSSLSTSPLTAIKASLGTLTACGSGPDRSLGYFPICWKPGGKQMYANLGWPVARGAGPLEFPHPIRKPCLG